MAAQGSSAAAGPALLAPSTTPLGLAPALAGFEPVSLEAMDSVALLARRDTKFVLSERQVRSLLPALADDYRVLAVEGSRVHAYRTVYFDTLGMDLFQAHHNSQPRRYKVRSRCYVDSALNYFEIKARDGRENTVKSRQQTERMVTVLSPLESTFIETHAPYAPGELAPRLWNSFSRVTLVDIARCERLTLDFGLVFAANGEIAGLPGLVVAELKHSRLCHNSPFLGLVRAANLHAGSFSKYCIGVSLLYPELKHNAFKRELRLAGRISGDNDVD